VRIKERQQEEMEDECKNFVFKALKDEKSRKGQRGVILSVLWKNYVSLENLHSILILTDKG